MDLGLENLATNELSVAQLRHLAVMLHLAGSGTKQLFLDNLAILNLRNQEQTQFSPEELLEIALDTLTIPLRELSVQHSRSSTTIRYIRNKVIAMLAHSLGPECQAAIRLTPVQTEFITILNAIKDEKGIPLAIDIANNIQHNILLKKFFTSYSATGSIEKIFGEVGVSLTEEEVATYRFYVRSFLKRDNDFGG